ncbi:MAG TPA: hypothetical protein DIU09_05040 [Hyphomonadaceae bacterium]|nr:hypothetical protein [Hyphomonadaceae bacterium]
MRQRSLLLVLPMALAIATYAPKAPDSTGAQVSASDNQPALFRHWLSREPSRAAEFADFERFLIREKVDGILPAWSLLWVDRHLASRKCPTEPFVLPPKEQWPKLVPTLKLIRDHVQPSIGPVEVVSGFRTKGFNACIGGASRSAHLQFGALDLIPVNPAKAPHEPYKSLCRMWRTTPTTLALGLGAYYDPDYVGPRGRQRFHIDTFGKRTWGFGYGAKTSFCLDDRSR